MMDLLHYTFFQHALLGSLFASIACGIIGTYIVTRRLVFISGGITHASFGGIGIGLYTGISPILSAAVFSVLSAFGVEWLSKRSDMREDSAIAVFWTFGMAIGIIFSFLAPGFTPDLSSFLFGNILTITRSDILLLGILSLMLALFFALFLRPIVAIAFDPEFARSQKASRHFFRICPDGVHRPDYRGMPPHGRHRARHFLADPPANDSKPFYLQVQIHYLAIHRHRLHQLPGRAVHLLQIPDSIGSLYHFCVYFVLYHRKDKPYRV